MFRFGIRCGICLGFEDGALANHLFPKRCLYIQLVQNGYRIGETPHTLVQRRTHRQNSDRVGMNCCRFLSRRGRCGKIATVQLRLCIAEECRNLSHPVWVCNRI